MDGTIWDHSAIVRVPRIERNKKHKLKDDRQYLLEVLQF